MITPPEKQDQDLHMTRWALAADLPVLGICYGLQEIAHAMGGKVAPAEHREYVEGRGEEGGTTRCVCCVLCDVCCVMCGV